MVAQIVQQTRSAELLRLRAHRLDEALSRQAPDLARPQQAEQCVSMI